MFSFKFFTLPSPVVREDSRAFSHPMTRMIRFSVSSEDSLPEHVRPFSPSFPIFVL
nr:MAG TPA: hypothetical protein [Caudoviricetes sp.]